MRKPVGKRLLPPATVGALPLDSTGLMPAVLKVADLGGVMGLDAGFRSASRSVAGRASPRTIF